MKAKFSLSFGLRVMAQKKASLRSTMSQVLVAHACNPSYSGGRDQHDPGSKPAWTNSL
jgi:hypothetical protein